MSAPTGPVVPPDRVLALAAGRPVRCVWVNHLGGLTFELGGPAGPGAPSQFVKWQPGAAAAGIAAEVRRLRWAAPFTPVPRVLDTGRDDDAAWLLTAAIGGESAVAAGWRAQPLQAARSVGRGLRALHEALPVERCPFDWGVDGRVVQLARETGRPAADVRAALGPAPPLDRLVVCHGDACLPNTLLAPDGTPTGHVDLGAMGVADRWADLAVASWSTVWNYGPGYEVPLLAAYGVEPDPVRLRFYRELWGSAPSG